MAQIGLQDQLGRPLRDLRVSLTDQCNFRCRYCMPKEVFDKNYTFLPRVRLLSFSEIEAVARTAIQYGVQKIRLTGGEPLLRRHIEQLVERLCALGQNSEAPLDIALTTNGTLLAAKAASLKAAGLRRVTVSLDALEDSVFQAINGVGATVASVLRGIDAALRLDFDSVKVNVVVRRGWNEDQILPLLKHFYGSPVEVRFIEYMDTGHSTAWNLQHVFTAQDMLERIQQTFDLQALAPQVRGETAQRWAYANQQHLPKKQQSSVGIIASVTRAFCGDCTRLRLTADGKLFTCLFAGEGTDLMPLLRPLQLSALEQALHAVWMNRVNRYSELRTSPLVFVPQSALRRDMHYLGG